MRRTLGRHLAHISCSHLLVMPDDSSLEPLQSCLHTSNIIAYQCRCSCVDFSCQSEECIFLELENSSYFRKQITTELPVASNNLAHRELRIYSSISLYHFELWQISFRGTGVPLKQTSLAQKCQALERKQQLRVNSLGITIVSKLNVFARLTRRRKTKNFKRAVTQVIQQNNLNTLIKQEQ